MKHKVSIIIPCFNEEKNIKACLDSVFNLKYSRQLFEVIVVDNGSTDNTRDVANQYEITLIRDDQKSVAGLRNLGAKYAHGNILAFIDADCMVSETWLMRAQQYFNEMEVVLWGAPPVIPKNATWVQQTWFLVRQKKDEIEEVEWLESMNMFVRKDLFTEIKGFNENLETAEDVDFSYRISKKGKIISDMSINVVHTGEAADLKAFIKKEIWRGSTNLSGIISHGLSVKEFPSLIVPLFYGIFLPGILAWAIWAKSFLLVCSFFVFYAIPVFMVLVKVILKKPDAEKRQLFKLFFLIQIYFFARSVSLMKIK